MSNRARVAHTFLLSDYLTVSWLEIAIRDCLFGKTVSNHEDNRKISILWGNIFTGCFFDILKKSILQQEIRLHPILY